MATLKYSRQRETIYRHLLGRKDHPTAEMIYTALRGDDPRLSLGTVYRNLGLLVQLGQIRKLAVEAGPDRYDARIEPHGHFFCIDCGCITDFKVDEADRVLKAQVSAEGKTVEYIDLTVYGRCEKCSSRE